MGRTISELESKETAQTTLLHDCSSVFPYLSAERLSIFEVETNLVTREYESEYGMPINMTVEPCYKTYYASFSGWHGTLSKSGKTTDEAVQCLLHALKAKTEYWLKEFKNCPLEDRPSKLSMAIDNEMDSLAMAISPQIMQMLMYCWHQTEPD